MSKIFQIKLALDIVTVAMVLFSNEVPTVLKIGYAMSMFDYTMLCSKRIEQEQNKEKQK